jgi:hypothetical protein
VEWIPTLDMGKTKTPFRYKGRSKKFYKKKMRLKGTYSFHKLALKVGRFVIVDNIALSQSIDHTYNCWQQGLGSLFVFLGTQFFDSVTSSFMLIPIAKTYCFVPSNSF